ncbi:MAG: methylmalonyl-CoA mutase family protein [Chloroflexota bacterium]
MSSLFNKNESRRLGLAAEHWLKECYRKDEERRDSFITLSGIPVAPLYTPADIAEMDYADALGFPGKEPFTRGVYPTMYRGRLWTVRQLAGFGPPEETNKRLRFLIKQGATGLNITFSYPTLRGYNSDDPESEGDAGRGGVAIDSVQDMQVLFSRIPIDQMSVSLVTCNPSTAVSLFSMYLAVAEKRRMAPGKLTGTTQNDFLMETAVTVAPEPMSPRQSFRLSCDLIEYCIRQVPRWNPISYTGYNYREAGATAVQEIGFVIANAIAGAEETMRRGWGPDTFLPRLSFFLSAHNDFFEEIAKYRAARRVWGRVVRERLGSKDQRSALFRFHVQTAGVALTAQQPLNNVARAAFQGLAAVLGGAQSLHVDGYDEALCTPTEKAALLALRTQQIIQYETGVVNTIDPLGGSYFVESLTDELEQRVWDYLEEIEAQGGIVAAAEKGWVHREIAMSAHQQQCAIESGERKVVGLNCFHDECEEEEVELFETPETVKVQKAKLDRLRKERSQKRLRTALDSLRARCADGGNVMPAVLDCVRSLATLREVADVLRQELGVWRIPLV